MSKTNNIINVLLVEDEKVPQIAALYMLKECGCQADIAASGRDALNTLPKRKYQIIFMDLGLPDMEGCEVAKRIRDSGSNIPIIALTAHNDDEIKAKCLAVGMDDFLSKPLTVEKIRKIMAKFALER